MRKFFEEFKVFITRGNVIDMAVGVTIGSAFTAIVTAVSTNIIKPVINWIISLLIGAETLSECFTFLGEKPADLADPNLDLTLYNYIDWGAFINAIINFLVIAFVLFCVVKAINNFNEKQKQLASKLVGNSISADDRKEMKKQGIKLRDKAAVEAYFAAKTAAEEEAARLEREANPTVEDLLKDIRELLKK